jgi:uncharacterized damage-inducible protein DinB
MLAIKETERISSLIKAIYNGHPWLDVNFTDNLSKLTCQLAGRKAHPRLNSIWEIVEHLVSWRMNVLKRVQGDVIKTPDNNYFAPVTEQSEEAWMATMARFQESQDAWIKFLAQSGDDILEKIYPVDHKTYYEHIHGIIQHDAYHLGQIVLLTKMLQE